MVDDDLPTSVGILDRAPPLGGVSDSWSGPEGAFDRPEPEAPAPPVEDVGDPETLAACAKLEQNDTDNGRRMLLHFGPELQHVREVGWHTWSGKRWVCEGGDDAVTAYAQRTAKRMHFEVPFIDYMEHETAAITAAEELRKTDERDWTKEQRRIADMADAAAAALKGRRGGRHKFATSSGNAGKIAAMISQALPHRSIGPKDLDADPMLFNVENCTLKFSRVIDEDRIGDHHDNFKLKVERLDHNRDHFITKMAPVVYDPDAKAPRFMAFLERFQPKPEVSRFLQTYHGLCLTGDVSAQCFVYLYGTGANGKSTFMEALGALFGGYSDLLNAESLTGQGQRRGDQATPDIAELPGSRYLRISELPRGEQIRESLVKVLTGGEELKARHLNKGFFKFTPCFKAAMSGNDKPQIGGLDNGIWRRVKLILWEVMIPDGERRPMNEVLAEFAEERSGILNWLIEGLDRYMREGLITPDAVSLATSEYRQEMDPIGAFAKDCIVAEDGRFVTARDMYHGFLRWCEANSIRPWKETMFGRHLPAKGFVRENGRVRRYLNVRLDLTDLPELQGPRTPHVD